MGWRGVGGKGVHTQKEVVPKKKHFFVIEKYIEHVKQDEKVQKNTSRICWSQ